MVRDALRSLTYMALLCVSADALAEDEELPDIEFLEYLGMWDVSDEEWLLLEDDAVADTKERSEPVPEGEASTETNDES